MWHSEYTSPQGVVHRDRYGRTRAPAGPPNVADRNAFPPIGGSGEPIPVYGVNAQLVSQCQQVDIASVGPGDGCVSGPAGDAGGGPPADGQIVEVAPSPEEIYYPTDRDHYTNWKRAYSRHINSLFDILLTDINRAGAVYRRAPAYNSFCYFVYERSSGYISPFL